MPTVKDLIALIKAICEAFRCNLACICGNKKSEHGKHHHKHHPKPEGQHPPSEKDKENKKD